MVLDTLEVVKDTFIDGELSEYYSDLLYKVELIGGEPAYVYVLFDHKSYYDPLVGFQLLRYMVRIWERSLRKREARALPVIIPVVIYHGRGRWKARSSFDELFEAGDEFRDVVPFFRYQLCDLRRYSDDDIKGVVLSKVAFLALKHVFSDDLSERLPGILSLLGELSGKRSSTA